MGFFVRGVDVISPFLSDAFFPRVVNIGYNGFARTRHWNTEKEIKSNVDICQL